MMWFTKDSTFSLIQSSIYVGKERLIFSSRFMTPVSRVFSVSSDCSMISALRMALKRALIGSLRDWVILRSMRRERRSKRCLHLSCF